MRNLLLSLLPYGCHMPYGRRSERETRRLRATQHTQDLVVGRRCRERLRSCGFGGGSASSVGDGGRRRQERATATCTDVTAVSGERDECDQRSTGDQRATPDTEQALTLVAVQYNSSTVSVSSPPVVVSAGVVLTVQRLSAVDVTDDDT